LRGSIRVSAGGRNTRAGSLVIALVPDLGSSRHPTLPRDPRRLSWCLHHNAWWTGGTARTNDPSSKIHALPPRNVHPRWRRSKRSQRPRIATWRPLLTTGIECGLQGWQSQPRAGAYPGRLRCHLWRRSHRCTGFPQSDNWVLSRIQRCVRTNTALHGQRWRYPGLAGYTRIDPSPLECGYGVPSTGPAGESKVERGHVLRKRRRIAARSVGRNRWFCNGNHHRRHAHRSAIAC